MPILRNVLNLLSSILEYIKFSFSEVKDPSKGQSETGMKLPLKSQTAVIAFLAVTDKPEPLRFTWQIQQRCICLYIK